MRLYDNFQHFRIETTQVDFNETVGLAERCGLSLYDASYLWLARHLGVELVTLDKKLERAAATP